MRSLADDTEYPVESARLVHHRSSGKVYSMLLMKQLWKNGTVSYEVRARFGPAAAPSRQSHTYGPFRAEFEAAKKFSSVLTEKLAKGYDLEARKQHSAPAQTSSPAPATLPDASPNDVTHLFGKPKASKFSKMLIDAMDDDNNCILRAGVL